MNDGRPGWGPLEHLIADLWRLLLQVHSKDPENVDDHPVRAEMLAKAVAREKAGRLAGMKARFANLKRKYGKRSGG